MAKLIRRKVWLQYRCDELEKEKADLIASKSIGEEANRMLSRELGEAREEGALWKKKYEYLLEDLS